MKTSVAAVLQRFGDKVIVRLINYSLQEVNKMAQRVLCEQLLKSNGFKPAGFDDDAFYYERDGFFGRVAMRDDTVTVENMVTETIINVPTNVYAVAGVLVMGGVLPITSFIPLPVAPQQEC